MCASNVRSEAPRVTSARVALSSGVERSSRDSKLVEGPGKVTEVPRKKRADVSGQTSI